MLLQLVESDGPDVLQMAALSSLMRYNEPRIGESVVARYPSLSVDSKTAALPLLSSRAPWSLLLLQAVDAGRMDAAGIPHDAVRLMTMHQDAAVADLVRKHWPEIEGASSAEMQTLLAHVSEVLQTGSGDPYRGKAIYRQSCGKCHLLFGDGGRIGPDLTSYQRKDQNRMLLNVINPSAEIREGFESWMVLTLDGRVLSGFLFDQDNQVIVLRGVDGQNVTVARDEIDVMEQQAKSLMPEGLLKDLNEQQVRDLFAFLQASQPLND